MLRIIGCIGFMRLMVTRITRQKHPEHPYLLVLLVRRHALHLLRQRPDHASGRMRASNAGNLLTFKCAFIKIRIGRRENETARSHINVVYFRDIAEIRNATVPVVWTASGEE